MIAGAILRALGEAAATAVPQGPLVSAWLAMPVAGFVLALLALHMRSLAAAPMPESRRRIRIANGWIMLFATPVTAYAFGMATPDNPRGFVLAWLAVAGLLGIVLLLAGIDIVNTGRISAAARRQLQRELRDHLQGRVAPQGGEPHGTGGGPGGANG